MKRLQQEAVAALKQPHRRKENVGRHVQDLIAEPDLPYAMWRSYRAHTWSAPTMMLFISRRALPRVLACEAMPHEANDVV